MKRALQIGFLVVSLSAGASVANASWWKFWGSDKSDQVETKELTRPEVKLTPPKNAHYQKIQKIQYKAVQKHKCIGKEFVTCAAQLKEGETLEGRKTCRGYLTIVSGTNTDKTNKNSATCVKDNELLCRPTPSEKCEFKEFIVEDEDADGEAYDDEEKDGSVQ